MTLGGSAVVCPVVCEIFQIGAQHMNIHALPVSRCAPSVRADLLGRDAVTAAPAKHHVAFCVLLHNNNAHDCSRRQGYSQQHIRLQHQQPAI